MTERYQKYDDRYPESTAWAASSNDQERLV